jgi:hypothetical protein
MAPAAGSQANRLTTTHDVLEAVEPSPQHLEFRLPTHPYGLCRTATPYDSALPALWPDDSTRKALLPRPLASDLLCSRFEAAPSNPLLHHSIPEE